MDCKLVSSLAEVQLCVCVLSPWVNNDELQLLSIKHLLFCPLMSKVNNRNSSNCFHSNADCFTWNLTRRSPLLLSLQVNDIDVANMSHTDAVSFLRAAPKTVRLVLGRVLELPKMPVLPHLLPDITLTCHEEELGNTEVYSFLL